MKSSWGISPETPDEAKAEQVRERTPSTFQRSKFMRLTTPLLAVLNVLADTPQVHPRRDPSGSSIAREPIPDGITSVVYWMHHR